MQQQHAGVLAGWCAFSSVETHPSMPTITRQEQTSPRSFMV